MSAKADAQALRAARSAGLRWVNDGEAGIAREAGARGPVYRDSRGRLVRDAAVLARIRTLAIPPAWQDVWICADDSGHLQATGRDARGRKQYRYHAQWQAQRGDTKFDALREFGRVLPRVRGCVQRALAGTVRGDALASRARVLATLVRLLDVTWLRIGNAEYARSNRSFGLSTLRNRHAGVHGDELQLSFVGKSGVRHEARLSDRRVARVVRRCRELPGQELFQYLDEAGATHRVDSSDVNAWLAEAAGEHVTAKDFRTWHGSVLALDLVALACTPGAAACTKQQVLVEVARRLGNTPAVCRKAYVHPRVLALLEALSDEAERLALHRRLEALGTSARRGLNAAETRLMALLATRPR